MRKEVGDEQKKDYGKTQWSLIPADFMKELAEVFTLGAQKYGPHKWREGMRWSRVLDAHKRHLSAWELGEARCPTDGQHHLVSVVWTAIVLWWYEKYGGGTDDRADVAPKGPKVTFSYEPNLDPAVRNTVPCFNPGECSCQKKVRASSD